ncbi:hypothetical protein JOD24_002465 [Kroppenstedtia sanguinis]
MPRWIKSCMLLLLVGAVAACQGGNPALFPQKSSFSPEKSKKRERFVPYRDQVVPPLKELIQRKGFRQYTQVRPYLLGYSYDGNFAAVVVYDSRAQAYRVDLFHTGTHQVQETVYAPSQVKKKGSEEEELLALTQETLDLGYRIQVPTTPEDRVTHRGIWTSGKQVLKFTLKQVDRTAVLKVEKGRERWELARFPLKKGERLTSRWLVSSSPSAGEKWTVVASSHTEGHQLRPLMYTLDASMLTPDWTEDRLEKRLKAVLGTEAQVAFRGKADSQKRPEFFLAVRGGSFSTNRPGEAPRLSGTVDRFVILDARGRVRFRGNIAGLVQDEQVLLDPSIPRDPRARYRLLLFEEESKENQPILVLTVDQLNGKGRTVKTYELSWDAKAKSFRYEG